MKEVIDAIDTAYGIYEKNQFQMPTRMQVEEDNNTLLLMPCSTEESIGTKLVTVFPDNETVPTLHGLVVLNCSKTGEMTAILDGSFLTGLRTGAIGGSAVRHLAHREAESIAVIGAGVQGLYQAIAACAERPITDIYIYTRTQEKVSSFTKELRKWIGNDIHIHNTYSPEDALQHAEIVITATTSSTPVLSDDASLLKNKLFIGIGSFQPTMREFPRSLYTLADHIFIDTKDAILESGDIATPLEKGWINQDVIQPMSTYISKHSPMPVKLSKEKSIIFKSTGMALFDVVVGNLIYKKAVEKNIGNQLTF